MARSSSDGPQAAAEALRIVRENIYEIVQRTKDAQTPSYDTSSSPWNGRAVFIVGPPRSGTTWLHQLISTHPDVASSGEMHVMCEGVSALFQNFDNPDPYMGLSTWVTRPELLSLTRALIDGIFTAGANRSGKSAGFVLDKSPNHAMSASLLAEIYPDATFLNIIRDPRDSLSSANQLWSSWAESVRNWTTSASSWRDNVRDNRDSLGNLRYYEVRYEDLLAQTHQHLTAMFELIGLAHNESFVQEAIDFARAPINVSPSNQTIKANKWSDIDPLAERAIVAEASELMIELGYLTAAESAEILGRVSPRDRVAELSSAARTTARRAGGRMLRTARAGLRSGTSSTTPSRVRSIATELCTAVQSGNDTALRALLASDVGADLADGSRVTGADAVIRVLHDMLDGTAATPVMADHTAAAIEVTPASGARRSLSLFVRGESVTRVRVNDAGDPR